MPAELDQIYAAGRSSSRSRRRRSSKEKDAASRQRLGCSEGARRPASRGATRMRAQLGEGGQAIRGCGRCAKQLEQARLEIEQAERAYDLNRAAELRHGVIPELERRAAAPRGAASGQGRRAPLLSEEVERRGHRRGRRAAGPASRHPAPRGRAGEAAAPRREPARARRRPGRGGPARRRRHHPRPRRHQGPAPADRFVHLPRTHRRRQDRAGQGAGRDASSTTRTTSSGSTCREYKESHAVRA